MKILLMSDMEGCAGILNHDDWVMPDGRYYQKGLRISTAETNAAVDGFFAAGATEVVVLDGHGAGGIDPELLDARAQLIRFGNEAKHPWGLDATYDGLAFVGQHAKAGTPFSHITHTEWFNFLDQTINGISVGEYGQQAFCARELGVPTIFAAGEQALTVEAEALTPGVVTVAVKQGLDPDEYDHLDTNAYRQAKLGARHLAPQRAQELVRGGANQAIQKLRRDPSAFYYPDLQAPYIRTVRFRQDNETPPYTSRNEHPTSIIALLNLPFTPIP